MSKEFKPLVPSTHKGKASFSITNNRINRVSVTSGAATSYVSSQDTSQERGGEVARRSGLIRQSVSRGGRDSVSGGIREVGGGDTRQLQQIVPRISKASAPTNSQKVLLNTSGSAKYLLVNTSQMKPPLKRAGRESVPHIAIKRPSTKPYTPILPHAVPHRTPDHRTPESGHVRHGSGDSSLSHESSQSSDPSVGPIRFQPGPSLPKQPVAGAIDGGIYPRPKKPCNCTKSMCLKLYCDCFANGEFCSGCNCQNCHNNIQHESERYESVF